MLSSSLARLLVAFNVFIPLFAVCQKTDTAIVITSQQNEAANQQYIELYKENADFSFTSPKGEIGAPSKYIIEGRLTTTYMLLGTKSSSIAFALIPDFTVRVRSEKSAGVRTPSFRLGGVSYIRLSTQPQQYKYAELAFTHHSNGQDGSALNTDGSINTQTGNFSTNYLTASYRFGYKISVHSPTNSYSIHHRMGLQWHKWFNYEPVLQNNYAFTRLLYNLSWRKYTTYISTNAKRSWRKRNLHYAGPTSVITSTLQKEALRLNLESSYAVNKLTDYNFISFKKRLNIEANLHFSLPFMNRAMFMISSGYYGEDPYNIYYQDKYAFIRVGISTGFMRYKISQEKF